MKSMTRIGVTKMSDLKIFTDNIEPEALNQIYTLVKTICTT